MPRGATKRWWPLTRVTVTGASMAPHLLPGDRLVVLRTRRVRPGDIAVAADPRDPSRPLVKRVADIQGAGVVLVGDNAAASTDSRAFGPVPRERLRGRAVYRYAPSERAGLL
ncbi:MAG TPA: nickel-type superoxide dismutase maturation protease [Egibacteraceae bacterium]|nr:nickel-type superoxide dismutase maturation protease [Egibacteraceae bacterium]